jgi:hypothetical protein
MKMHGKAFAVRLVTFHGTEKHLTPSRTRRRRWWVPVGHFAVHQHTAKTLPFAVHHLTAKTLPFAV